MLSMSTYPRAYVAECRARVDAQVDAYRDVAKAARAKPAGSKAVDAFEPQFFNGLVLVLDQCFMHRARAAEGKDGNPMNEVRLLCTSILSGGGRLVADKGIRLRPETSVLGLAVGDEVALTEPDFVRLSTAYFDAISDTYGG